jgi:glycosyltransferase involved in cell wall biosynthesis
MSVVLSMLTLVPGSMGGSETYARELIRELSTRELEISTLVAPVARGFSQPLSEQVAPEYPTGVANSQRARALVLGGLRRQRLGRRIAGGSVVHYPFTVPVPPPRRGQRSLVSLLDVQHHDLPALFSRPERAYRSITYDRAARRADAVITISEFAKERIVTHLGIDPARVHVAHLGVRMEEFTPQLGPREEFLLYPAKGWAHKNHATLFDAFRILRHRNPRLELVLTGAAEAELPAIPNGVEVRGQVSQAALVHLYRNAAALVFPSRYEGFGLPVVEAMSSGCPVAAAAAGSLPEVVGDAGVLFDPTNAEDLARGVDEALDRASQLQPLGLERARAFTWSACADVHERVYRGLGG